MKIMHKTLCLVLVASLLCLCGCRNKLGYFLVIWPKSDTDLKTAEIYPIKSESYIRSTYIVKVGRKKFAEISKFRGLVFSTEEKALSERDNFLPFKNAFCYVDSKTPLRETPDELSARIYILRENQIVKVIGRGADKVKIGKNLEGYWYRVVTEDGAIGYCFDKNITFYVDDGTGESLPVDDAEALSKKFLAGKWYPLEYKDAMAEKYPDLKLLSDGRCLWGDAESRAIFSTRGQEQSRFDFSAIKQSGKNCITFAGSPVDVTFYPDGKIYARFSESSAAGSGFFVQLDEPLDEYLDAHRAAKNDQYKKLCDGIVYFDGSDDGFLRFEPDMRFVWTDRSAAAEDFIPAVNGISGTVSNDRYVTESLRRNFGCDGVVTLTFSQTSRKISFVHKFLPDGRLQLTHVPEEAFSALVLSKIPEDQRTFNFTRVAEGQN